ncbi:MAG TPA: hypothetical protein VFS43_21205 [Polyangiaceae bacterium]|nr:hypothetical protein [Polyangiaceae bacterium]
MPVASTECVVPSAAFKYEDRPVATPQKRPQLLATRSHVEPTA